MTMSFPPRLIQDVDAFIKKQNSVYFTLSRTDLFISAVMEYIRTKEQVVDSVTKQ